MGAWTLGAGVVRAGRWTRWIPVTWILSVAVLTVAWALPAAAIGHQVSILLDTDDDATTGCTVATPSGPFPGVEQVLVTTVDTVSLPADAATVTAVDRQVCGPGNVLGVPVAVDPGDWPVGVSLGVDGFHVVETFLPLAALPTDARVLRAAIVVTDQDGVGSALLTTLPGAGQPIIIDLRSILEIPTVSQWGLLLLVLLLAGAAALRLRRLPAAAALVVVLVLTTGGVAWAACVLDGDPGEWAPGLLIAEDPPALCDGVSIRAVFAQHDATRICFRVDACLRFNSAPVAQGQGVVTDEDTPVVVVLGATDPDGDPIAGWNVVAPGPVHGTLSGVAPNLTYTPNPDYAGADSFQFTATDGTATSVPATVSLAVTPVNDAPVVTPAAFPVAEDAAVGTAIGTVAFADPDAGQAHTFAITAGNVGGAFAIAPASGEITVAAPLDFETLAAYSLTVEVTDDGTPVLSGSATVDVTVVDVDDAPVAVGDAATVTEDDPATTIDVRSNDTDVDGGPMVIQSVTQPANGTVVVTNAGVDLTYEPDADHCNDGTPFDTFTYTLNGGSTATVSVTVTCVDDAPVAEDDATTVAEDAAATAIDVLANDTDVDGGAISVDSVVQPANGTVSITGGGTGLTYQPDADYCNDGSPLDTFTYTLAPGGSTATVSVTVTCVDDVPVAVDDGATVGEDSGINVIAVLGNDTDVDGGPISVASVTQPANGTAAVAGGGVSYTPNANYCNDGSPVDTFTYTLAPGGSVATVSVTVSCVDDPPTAVADGATVDEDSVNNPIDVLLNDVDLDGGPRTVTAVQSPTPAGGTVVITGGGSGVAYTPAADDCNNPPGTTPDTFTYTLNGGSFATVSVTVSCINDGPVVDLDADDDKGTVGTGFAVTFTENDPARLLADPNNPLGAVIADVDSTTLATLTVTLTNLLDAGEELLDADVSAFAPAITRDYDTTTPGVGVLTLTGPAPIADFVEVLRTITYRHTGNDPDTTARVVEVVANDGIDDGNTAVSTVTVVAVDDPPVAVADGATVNEDSGANVLDVLLNDTDVDGGLMEVQSVTQPANGSVSITGGGTGLSYAPDADHCNDGSPLDTFTYTLNGGSVATVSVSVTCVDDAPVAVADGATVAEDSGANAVDVLGNDTDADGGPISVATVTQPANGSVAITGGGTGVTYTPNPDYCNNPPGSTLDTFTYTLSPGGSSTSVTMTVTCADDDPVAVADAATVVEDSGANAVDVLANDTDVDGGAISVTSVTQGAGGSVAITGGGTGVSYTPNANYCNDPPGTTLDTFTYTLTPGGSSTTVTVTVTCVDDPPTAVGDLATVDEDSGANTIDVQANDTDVDGGVNTISVVTQPANGTVAITNAGADLTYTPNANFCNDPPGSTPETFTYTLSPGGSSALVSVLVNCINDPPVAGADSFETFGNTELRVDLLAAATPHVLQDLVGASGVLNNDSDPVEGSAVFVNGIVGCGDLAAPFDCSTAAGGRVVLEADGSFTYRPPLADPAVLANSVGDSFQYNLVDAEGGTATGTVNLTRNEVVWYVDPNAAPGGDGRSHAPLQDFAFLDGSLGTGDLDNADDFILVHDGALADSIELEAGQRLIGQGVGLSLTHGSLGPVQLLAAGAHPEVNNGGGDVVEVTSAVPARIAGLSLSGGGNAIAMNATGAYSGSATLAIENNVFRGAGAEGINFDGGATGALALRVRNNSWNAAGTHGGSAVDVRTTAGDVRLELSNNTGLLSTSPTVPAVWVDANGGTLTVTGFAANSVHPAAAGAGLVVNDARFDAVPGGAADRVYGGVTTIGSLGDPVGGAGLVLTNVTGDLAFGDAATPGDLDVYATGNALQASSTLVAGVPQLYLQVRSTDDGGSAVLNATGGAAVDLSSVGGDLRLGSLVSSNGLRGVSLVGFRPGSPAASFPATFRAPAGSSITTNNAAATAFRVDGSNAGITYAGTIASTAGRGVHLTSNAGSTMAFSGALTLNTGTSPAFEATGGGVVTATDTANTLATTTGTALNVANTVIGAGGLRFRSISANGAPNGIVLNNTLSAGADGNLVVSGTGAAASGGTIQSTGGTGIALTNTSNVSLRYMQVSNTGSHGLSGAGLVDETGGASPTLEVRDSRFTSPGDGDNESAFHFGTPAVPGNNTGRILVENVIVEQYEEQGIELANSSGTLVLDVVGTVSGPLTGTTMFDDNSDVHGQGGVLAVAQGTANLTVNVSGVVFNNLESEAIVAQSTAATSVLDVNLVGNVSRNGGGPDNFPSGGGFAIIQDGGGVATFDVRGNDVRDLPGSGIVLVADGAAEGRIGGSLASDGNLISGTSLGDGIRIDTDQLPGNGDNFTATILIQNNRIGDDATFPGIGDDGIQVLNRDGTKTLNLTILDNTIANTGSEALRLFTDADVSAGVNRPANQVRMSGNSISGIGVSDALVFLTQETAFLCLDVASNSLSGTNRNIALFQSGTGAFQISQASVAAVATANPGSTASSAGTIGFNATCNPALPANP